MSDFPYGLKPGLSYNLSLTTTSVASTSPVSVGIRVLRLVSTVTCRAALGVAPVATTANTNLYLPAGVVEYIQCSGAGTEKIAGVLGSGSGTLNITEMTS